MAFEVGDRVMFTGNVNSFWGTSVSKGTKGTVTKAPWLGSNYEVTLENGKKVTVSESKISKIGGGNSLW
jgi:hypothetical protein